MNIKSVTLSLTSALVGAALVLSIQASAQHEGHQMGGHTMGGTASTGVRQLHEVMMRTAKRDMAMPMPGGSDVDRHFSKMMADHHLAGIQMADVELKYGKSAAVKTLARQIKTLQTKERATLLKHAAMNHK